MNYQDNITGNNFSQSNQSVYNANSSSNSMSNYSRETFARPYSSYSGGIEIGLDRISNNLHPMPFWAYFLYIVLFSIPVLGTILAMVFSLISNNIPRRNLARAYFGLFFFSVFLLIAAIVLFLNLTNQSLENFGKVFFDIVEKVRELFETMAGI